MKIVPACRFWGNGGRLFQKFNLLPAPQIIFVHDQNENPR